MPGEQSSSTDISYLKKVLRHGKTPTGKSLIACSVFVGILFILKFALRLSLNDPLLSILGLTGGWMVAFLTSRWSGQAALLEQSRLSAYEGLSETISESKLKYSAMGQRLKNIASQLDWRNNPMLWVVVRWQNAPEALRQEWEDTEKLFMRFLTQWERRSLLFAENEPLRRALYDEHMRVADEWGAFWSDFIGTVHNNPQGPRSDEAAQQLESQLNTIGDRLFDLSTYLHDFGLCLQNQAMGPWVGDVLPDRAPMPPHKTLQQLAAEPIKPEGQS